MASIQPPPNRAWCPEPRWANPLIALLAMLVLLTAWGSLRRRALQAPNLDQVSLQGHLLDIQSTLGSSRIPWAALEAKTRNPWDRAVLAIHASEVGEGAQALRLIQGAPAPLSAAWHRAFGRGPVLPPQAWTEVERGLGHTHAASLLQCRLLEREGRDPKPLRQAEQTRLRTRLGVLGGLGLLVGASLLGGLGFAVFLGLRRPKPTAKLPDLSLGGHAVAILFLAWFLAMQLSGTFLQIFLGVFPFMKPWALTCAYLFHAALGTGLLCQMEGVGLKTLWRRMTPGPVGKSLAWGLGYLGLTVLLALALSMALSPFLQDQEPPQRELVEILGRARTLGTALPLFLTVAVVAPCFEELLFRGCLLPVLSRRIHKPWVVLLLGALAFGAMHLQPQGLPLLSLLGLTMGMAFLRTGNLWTSILIHGCWNGAQFVLMRALF